jgi:hypothetical protein
MFWRILRDIDEIEIAIRAKGTGFVGVGWRPKSMTKQCQGLILQNSVSSENFLDKFSPSNVEQKFTRKHPMNFADYYG